MNRRQTPHRRVSFLISIFFFHGSRFSAAKGPPRELMPQRRASFPCLLLTFFFIPITQEAEVRYKDIVSQMCEDDQISAYELVKFFQDRSELKRKDQEDRAILCLLRGYKSISRHRFVGDVKSLFDGELNTNQTRNLPPEKLGDWTAFIAQSKEINRIQDSEEKLIQIENVRSLPSDPPLVLI